LHDATGGWADETALELHPFAQRAVLDERAGELKRDPSLRFRGSRAVDLGRIAAGDQLVEGERCGERCLAGAAGDAEHAVPVDAPAMLVAAVELAQKAGLPGRELERLSEQRPFWMYKVVREEAQQPRHAARPAELVEGRRQGGGRLRFRSGAGAAADFGVRGPDEPFELERDVAPLRLAARGPVAGLQAGEVRPAHRGPQQ